MSGMKRILFYLIFLALACSTAEAQTTVRKVPEGKIYQTTIRNEAYKFDRAVYSIFIPEGIKKIRGVFIHQHGCTGEGRGEARASDIQYQAFAKKWGLAVVGPDLYPKPGSGCGDWRDPVDDGSGPALFAALEAIGKSSKHPELATAPFLLWGHSGGGYWVLSMLDIYPERMMAIVAYSPAFDPQFAYSEAAAKVPLLIRHAGPKDFNDPGVDCWGTALHTFSKLRKMDGLVSLAYNAGQNHNLSYLRYMAIPFFESVMAQQFSPKHSKAGKDMDQSIAWLCDTTTTGKPEIYRASVFTGNKQSMSWLPDSACAARFREFVMTNTIKDTTPSPAPEKLRLESKGDSIFFTWKAVADVESGIRCFNIYKNGQLFARYPSEGDFQKFSTNGDQAMPMNPPAMVFRFSNGEVNKRDIIGIATVNRFGLESSIVQTKFHSIKEQDKHNLLGQPR
jgi:poly(3-hydroxybutyrate) depolymerase